MLHTHPYFLTMLKYLFTYLLFVCTKSCFFSSPPNCIFCAYDEYDQTYLNTLQLSSSSSVSCISKSQSSTLIRKILVLNSDCPSCSDYYDANYTSLASAFQQEAKLVAINLYSELDFFLQNGQHYLILNNEEQLFRRSLVTITLQSLNNQGAQLLVKANKFYLFISKTFTIIGIDIIGNDINMQGVSPSPSCYLSTNLCCQDSDLINDYDNSNNCYYGQRIIPTLSPTTVYGLFNIEYIFDNPNLNDLPLLNITNCTFKNIVPLTSPANGFTSLIYLTTFSGNLIINQSILSGNYFSQGLILYSNSKYDLLQIVNN